MKLRSVVALLAMASLSAVLPAHAQRTAISVNLSPEAAAEAFTRTVFDVCVPAIAGNGVSSLAAAREGRVQPTQDAATRRQAGANESETVWEVMAARGVVTIRETQGRCAVSVYGPAVDTTLAALAGAAQPAGLRPVDLSGARSPLSLHLRGQVQARPIAVDALGAAPGAPEHQSKFSVITASVTAAH